MVACDGVCVCVRVAHPSQLTLASLLISSAFRCFADTIRAEGPLALYKGMTSPILGVAYLFRDRESIACARACVYLLCGVFWCVPV